MTTARASILRQGAAAALLWARFLWHVVLGGTTTAWLIVKPGARAPAGLVWLAYEGLSETGAAVLGCMVSLTPGSTVIDIDTDRRELLLHLLDTSKAEKTAAHIRRDFEVGLRELFPAESTP